MRNRRASLGGMYLMKTGVAYPTGKGILHAQEIQYMAPPLSDLSGVGQGSSMRNRMEKFIVTLQAEFCKALEEEENPEHKFRIDRWTREEGGGGITCNTRWTCF